MRCLLYGSYYVDVYLQNSILAFEFQSLSEALSIVELYVVNAQTISVYSYSKDPYTYEFNSVYPQKLVNDKEGHSVASFVSSVVGRLYRRKEDYQKIFYSHRTVRNCGYKTHRQSGSNHYRRPR